MPEDLRDLAIKFQEGIELQYEEAKTRCKYNASYYIRMIEEHTGVEAAVKAAKRLLAKPSHPVSSGLQRLWECDALDLSMEALVVESPWKALFCKDEVDMARKRLSKLGYKLEDDDE